MTGHKERNGDHKSYGKNIKLPKEISNSSDLSMKCYGLFKFCIRFYFAVLTLNWRLNPLVFHSGNFLKQSQEEKNKYIESGVRMRGVEN